MHKEFFINIFTIMPEQNLREIFLNYKQYPLSKEIGIYLINPERNKKDKLLLQIGYSILKINHMIIMNSIFWNN